MYLAIASASDGSRGGSCAKVVRRSAECVHWEVTAQSYEWPVRKADVQVGSATSFRV